MAWLSSRSSSAAAITTSPKISPPVRGDMLEARLRRGNAGSVAEAAQWIPQVVEQAQRHLCQEALVRFDAGFTGEATLEALDARGIGYIGRLPENAGLHSVCLNPICAGPGGAGAALSRMVASVHYQAGTWSPGGAGRSLLSRISLGSCSGAASTWSPI